MENGTYSQSQEPTRNEKVLVGTSSTIISFARQGLQPRKNIIIRNISTNALDIITINLGFNQAVADAGVVLKQNESFSDSSETGYDCYQGVISAICDTANGVLAIYER
jgi:hypothetical protein